QVRDGWFSAISERRWRSLPSVLTTQTSWANGWVAAAKDSLRSPRGPGVGVGAIVGALKSTAAKVTRLPSGEKTGDVNRPRRLRRSARTRLLVRAMSAAIRVSSEVSGSTVT